MEFEFCNVYRGTFGKTLPLLQRHPDAVVILWNPKDYDHVFFVTLSQLIPCLKQMRADHWSMIVFWSESTVTRPLTSPNVGLDYTDEPVPLPPPSAPPPQDGAGNDDDIPGPSGYQDPYVPDEIMPYDDLGDDPPDLGGTGGGPFGPGPLGPIRSTRRRFTIRRNRVPVRTGRKSSTTLSWRRFLPCRYQMIVTHPWSSYLMGLTVHHLMMTIRRILWKFTWSPLLQEDLQMHQEQHNHLLILIRSCNRHLTCHRPLLSRLFHFRNIRIFRFQESCVLRHLGMFR